MSNKKRNVAYIKPNEPAFLRRLKEQVGYKEGPNVDTKRERLAQCSDGSDSEEECPQIVVLKPGDLSADQVALHKKEVEEGRADLNRKVVFKKPDKSGSEESAEVAAAKARLKRPSDSKSSGSSKKPKDKANSAGALSFDAEEEDED